MWFFGYVWTLSLPAFATVQNVQNASALTQENLRRVTICLHIKTEIHILFLIIEETSCTYHQSYFLNNFDRYTLLIDTKTNMV